MKKDMIMGNEAIALGAMVSGVNFVTGYPGTPSTEVLESIVKFSKGDIYAEWSVNEKAAMEVAAGAAYAGAKTMVTMKQVGLNVASDPLMSLAYIGIKGAMVIVCADDPGPISSQTEQDTRNFAQFSKLPVFDPATVEEAYEMIQDAFKYSEEYGTPVLFRPTTRICHSYASLHYEEKYVPCKPMGFVKDTSKWVIFPKTSYMNHRRILKRNEELAEQFGAYRFNTIEGSGKKGIVTSGVSYGYVKEALDMMNVTLDNVRILKIATAYPFPESLALEFLNSVEELMAVEELDPVLENELLKVCGKHHININVMGKFTGHMSDAGENSIDSVKIVLKQYLGLCQHGEKCNFTELSSGGVNNVVQRPPVLCAGCPHRASFYAVKKAMEGRKAVFNGDIGCYTLGNAAPLNMVDTCLCMGAGITIAQGIGRVSDDTVNFAFIGDSTFFASGITGVINAVYNRADMVLVVLDNSITAMTGHQVNPGMGKNVFGQVTNVISIKKVLEGIGVDMVVEADPLDHQRAVQAVKKVVDKKGVRAIIFKSPCIAIHKSRKYAFVCEEECIMCGKCIREVGCPALYDDGEKIYIDKNLCNGCMLCQQVCPVNAIKGSEK
ncbi:indolepyruvate ferredoxin oxidoreductase alpha subunit [Hathewaya proteolytica DSM 3090]|uniref:Indolepyruvate oxidoreductase subunit IorA n=1 Tax=Hathewaya proteolytica DSM 3090 TaxID=1121331 RepID=A0A1M6JQK0_9CLOT|nr:indolepyruvate ferredoxin oxidoreductase subunit alpha [Hathewaya proteolytica]SHJ48989.1 indolepyruvate ferredoxin oxidoreductase alpha subunit [Hathewaya proteolytica DSM 3090]